MESSVFPTKSNLLQAKRSLSLAKVGYDLLDRKRSILMREMTSLMDEIQDVQEQIDATFNEAYTALRMMNFTIGQEEVLEIVNTRGFADDISIRYRSVMGVEIPEVTLNAETPSMFYGFAHTNTAFDNAYLKFLRVKALTAKLAAIENSVYKLAYAIKQSQKRANALKNIVIPRFEDTIVSISNYLEEKERESFIVMKIVKKHDRES